MKARVLKKIVRIESSVYPPQYRQMEHVKNMRDLTEYCEGIPHAETWDTGYLLYTESEIVDIASLTPMSLKHLNDIAKRLKKFFGNRVVYTDCRETTSYKIFNFFEKRGKISLLEDYSYLWGDEWFHEIKFIFL